MPRLRMDAFKIAVKFYVRDSSFLTADEFVHVFHSWIQQQAVADHTLIDVADYSHVKDGPGTVLVAHEANFYADRFDGRLGLTYSRKQPGGKTLKERLHQAIAAALEACARLESDPRLEGRIKFNTDELLVTLNDRLNAPNTRETFAAIEPELRGVLSEFFGAGPINLEHEASERALFAVRARSTTSAVPPALSQ